MISVVKRKRANYNLQIVIDVYSMSRDCGQSVVDHLVEWNTLRTTHQ